MKKYILKGLALLIFASTVTSCSVEYRERHYHHYDHDHYDHHDDHYRGY